MKIDNLSKVGLEIQFKSSAAPSTDSGAPIILDFIYGVASSGLSLLEQKLYQKEVGTSIQMSIPRASAAEAFGHAYTSFCKSLTKRVVPDMLELTITVISVSNAQEREVIQAIAQSVGHGCGGGSCDCGCG